MSDPIAGAAKKGGGSMAIFGILMIVLGFLAMASPMMVGFSIAMLIGIIMIAAGIMRIIWAFQADSFGQGVLKFAVGALTVLFGVMLLARPLFAVGTLTVFLAIYFIVDGIFEVIGAFEVKPDSGWGWVLFGGVISLMLGIMIWSEFPLSGVWAVGTLVGIKLLFSGTTLIALGSGARNAAKSAVG